MIIKCKMCGGDLNIQEGNPICECEFCGTHQTIPQGDNDKKANLFNRANRLRMCAEFDKAATVYASIVAEFPEEAEAYWGLCLCKYGIEYVDDPMTGNKIPTCNRTLPKSIMDDEDFDQACENADAIAKRVYREEAKTIDQIQRGILSIVSNEEPYDVFICYKETAEDGGRTEDSVLGQEIYDSLIDKGLKVFFSRISLENKLGQQYEPYIYAALSSADVMLVIGTKYEYYDAAWVKNEWMRFLSMMKSQKGKTLIPCYKDLDAYDMPKEFKNLQGQDMSKIGWLQDLTRGILKICGKEKHDPYINDRYSYMRSTEGLEKRAFAFLDDEAWENADNYAERILDIDINNGRAYLIKLLAKNHARTVETLCKLEELFDEDPLCKKILQSDDESLKDEVNNCLDKIKTRKENIKQIRDNFNRRKEEREKSMIPIDELKKEIEVSEKEHEHILHELKNHQIELQRMSGIFSGKRKKELESIIPDEAKKEMSARDKVLQLRKRLGEFEKALPEAASKDDLVYQIGKIYLEDQIYTKASLCFETLRGYKDVEDLIRTDSILFEIFREKDEKEKQNAQRMAERKAAEEIERLMRPYRTIGNKVNFGHFSKSKKIEAEKEPIVWRVLDVADNKALLLSCEGLDGKEFHLSDTATMWERCFLRGWLNGYFLTASFSSDEMSVILDSLINRNYSVPRTEEKKVLEGSDVENKIFLLSYEEAEKYLQDKNIRYCKPTAYARRNGAYDNSKNGNGWWWLRTQGSSPRLAVAIGTDGNYFYANVNEKGGMIRPAMWIDLSSPIWAKIVRSNSV